jgi:hypothetical protein
MHKFPDKLRLRTPKGLPRAIEVAAAAQHTQPAEWARRALLRGLEEDGVRLMPDGQIGSSLSDRADRNMAGA